MSDLDSLVADVLAVTPVYTDGTVLHHSSMNDGTRWGAPEPIAAKQAAAVLRAHADWLMAKFADSPTAYLLAGITQERADELDPPKETTE